MTTAWTRLADEHTYVPTTTTTTSRQTTTTTPARVRTYVRTCVRTYVSTYVVVRAHARAYLRRRRRLGLRRLRRRAALSPTPRRRRRRRRRDADDADDASDAAEGRRCRALRGSAPFSLARGCQPGRSGQGDAAGHSRGCAFSARHLPSLLPCVGARVRACAPRPPLPLSSSVLLCPLPSSPSRARAPRALRCVRTRARALRVSRRGALRARRGSSAQGMLPARAGMPRQRAKPELYPTRPLMLHRARCEANDMLDVRETRPQVTVGSWWEHCGKCTQCSCYCTGVVYSAGDNPLLRQCRLYRKSHSDMVRDNDNTENLIVHGGHAGGRIPKGTWMEVFAIDVTERCTAIQVRCHHEKLDVHPGLAWAILWVDEGFPSPRARLPSLSPRLGSLSARKLDAPEEAVEGGLRAHALAHRSAAQAAAPKIFPWVHCSTPSAALAEAASLPQ